MQKIEIWQPRYKDRTVLIAAYKVGADNEIVFTKAKHLAGKSFYVSGENIKKHGTTTNGKITCYVVPMDELELIERED